MKRTLQLAMASLLFSFLLPAQGQTPMITHQNLVYAQAGDSDLLLDLYVPEGVAQPPLVLWLHGGIWRVGSKDNPPVLGLVDQGFALASVEFRSSSAATFPAQIHDIKAAIRYLRGTAAEHGIDASRIAVWGYSSGGHLAALTGVSNGNAQLEGSLGDYLQQSSDVQAIVETSGPTNLHSILHQSTPHGVSVRAPGMADLLGKPVEDPAIQELATLASPALQVTAEAPPLFLMHGVQDNQVPINQAIELQQAYQRAGRPVETAWVPDAQHGSPAYFQAPYLDQVVTFLRGAL